MSVEGQVAGLVALVTGGASGLGAATVRLFASEGATVYAADVNPRGEEMAAALRGEGLDVHFLSLDVTVEEEWASVVAAVTAESGSLDILINNAGISGLADVDPMDVAYWHRLLDVNLTGPFLGIRAARSALAASAAAAVVSVSSVAGVVGVPTTHFGYSASKGGLRIMSKLAAVDLAADGIRVNTVQPGPLPPMGGPQKSTPGVGPRDDLSKTVPMGRGGEYEEVAKAMLFLASPAASYITGAELYVDGGYLAQ